MSAAVKGLLVHIAALTVGYLLGVALGVKDPMNTGLGASLCLLWITRKSSDPSKEAEE